MVLTMGSTIDSAVRDRSVVGLFLFFFWSMERDSLGRGKRKE